MQVHLCGRLSLSLLAVLGVLSQALVQSLDISHIGVTATKNEEKSAADTAAAAAAARSIGSSNGGGGGSRNGGSSGGRSGGTWHV
jgi:hypothetical protein